MGHHVGDIDRTYYRAKQEEQTWRRERDPLVHLKDWLLGLGQADQGMIDQIDRDIRDEMTAAVQFALDAPYPEPEEVTQHVYA
jgi:pyruvate dehydrogenase E1 component alpha subunit